jgi:hypothetical protein
LLYSAISSGAVLGVAVAVAACPHRKVGESSIR